MNELLWFCQYIFKEEGKKHMFIFSIQYCHFGIHALSSEKLSLFLVISTLSLLWRQSSHKSHMLSSRLIERQQYFEEKTIYHLFLFKVKKIVSLSKTLKNIIVRNVFMFIQITLEWLDCFFALIHQKRWHAKSLLAGFFALFHFPFKYHGSYIFNWIVWNIILK